MRHKPSEQRIQMPCLPAQRELLRAQANIVAFIGGLGSGKTTAAVYKAVQLGLLNAPSPGLFIEPSYTLVRDVAIEAFKEILGDRLNLPFKLHLTNFTIRVADTFDILLRSGEEAERIVGINAGWAIIDEPGKQSEEVGKNALARIRDPRARLHQLVLTGTPEGFNWFYDWTNKPTTFCVRARTTDNPHLPASYVESLKAKYTPEEVQAYINGEFVRFEGGWYRVKPRVLEHIAEGDIKIYKKPESTSGQLIIGVDTGGGLLRDRSAVAVIDKRDKSLVACWVSNSATVDELSSIVEILFHKYTRIHPSEMPGFLRAPPTQVPTIVVETNGIGRTTFQVITSRLSLPAVSIDTKDHTRYAGLLACKNLVEQGIIEGPEELAIEADQLVVDNGRFTGPKDLSMAIGFALLQLEKSPYKPPPQIRREPVFNMDFRPKKTWA